MPTKSLSFIGILEQAGWSMIPLYLCSLVGLAVVIRKLVEYRTAGVHKTRLLDEIAAALKAGDLDAVESTASKAGTPLGRVVAAAVSAVREHPARAEEEAGRVATSELMVLERYLNLLAFIAQVSPLFGLLGTVIGMVQLFSGMEAAGQTVDSSTLSAGIWTALLTTAAGLMIAIPLLGAHHWFIGQSDALRLHMKDGVARVLNVAFGKRPSSGRLKAID